MKEHSGFNRNYCFAGSLLKEVDQFVGKNVGQGCGQNHGGSVWVTENWDSME